MPAAVRIVGAHDNDTHFVLTEDALELVAHLHRQFNRKRLSLLDLRMSQQSRLDAGLMPDFSPSTANVRGGDWQVAPAPVDLTDRRVEITGPCDRKMMVHALNSGAKVFMADLEDSQSPTWTNILEGHRNLQRAVRRELDFQADNGKEYLLKDDIATLVVRPRGWHLTEDNVLVDGEPVSASLFDFGLHFFHNAKELLARGSGPYFYLPKLESFYEARLWNEVFVAAQDFCSIPQGTIRATVLIETIMAAFHMEEILYELKDHCSGLNAGRWDYIFSIIKRLRANQVVLPDRGQITMTVPFMRAYTELLVKSCHQHGAHAIGGMSAFIPNRKDQEVTAKAVEAVRHDKQREANDGFDGTWVAHPDLVPVAMEIFDRQLGASPHQKSVTRQEVQVRAADLLPRPVSGGQVTESGLRTNIRVAIQYVSRWLDGQGAVAIDNLMEDAATAEISRAQIWQWIRQEVSLSDGRIVTDDLYRTLRASELDKLNSQDPLVHQAAGLLDELVVGQEFTEFLTLPAYKKLQESRPGVGTHSS